MRKFESVLLERKKEEEVMRLAATFFSPCYSLQEEKKLQIRWGSDFLVVGRRLLESGCQDGSILAEEMRKLIRDTPVLIDDKMFVTETGLAGGQWGDNYDSIDCTLLPDREHPNHRTVRFIYDALDKVLILEIRLTAIKTMDFREWIIYTCRPVPAATNV